MSAIAFCLDDKPAYQILLKVAARSLRSLYGSDAPTLVCVYAGSDEALIRSIEAEDIVLARYTPVINPAALPPSCQHAVGCFLKLELALVPELADHETVLYCDTDVAFKKRPDALLAMTPKYMAMAKEDTLPFTHPHEQLAYSWRGNQYVVPLPFPIWTFNSGVVVFNLDRLRRHDYIHNFLAFCVQNADAIGNLDQSLLNYFFGKRITRLHGRWNCPPYRRNSMEEGSIIHFHGPKPWETQRQCFADLRVNDFEKARVWWKTWLTPEEVDLVADWEANN